jgi:ATP-dependent DNA helicase RecG
MTSSRLNHLLQQREGLRLEFKEAAAELPASLFETVCAFLNRAGGDILLGVADDGTVAGVSEARAPQLLKEIANLSNNPQKLDPPFILLPQLVEVQGKPLLHIQVPESSQVHKTKGVVYDRSEDGDYRLTNHTALAELYTRKSASYSENTIYPYLRLQDLRQDLFPKVRNLIRSRDYNHPWLPLNDEQLLHKAGLYRRDPASGKEGYTLAVVMLLGQDETIQSVLPQYKTDALLRRHDLHRYDDRLYVQTCLVEAYEQLMGFLAKHLPDKFFLEGTVRISLRSKIFREVVANLLVHREFTSGYPARLIIYADRVETLNANRPHTYGRLLPETFSPFTKNPVIAKFFTQLGHMDELGSGILNVNRYLPHYAPGKEPVFEEGDVFKMVIPLATEAGRGAAVTGKRDGVNEGISDGVNEGLFEGAIEGAVKGLSGGVKQRLAHLMRAIAASPGIKVADLVQVDDVSERTIRENLKILIDAGLVVYKGSKKSGGYELVNLPAQS